MAAFRDPYLKYFWHCVSIFFLFLLTSAGLRAHADTFKDHIVEQAIYFDETRSLSIAEVTNKSFRVFDGIMNSYGYTNGKMWLRLTISPSVDKEPIFLHIRPNNRNILTLYTPGIDGEPEWTAETTGNMIAWNDRPVKRKDLGFTLKPTEKTTYYISLETFGSASIVLEAYTQSDSFLKEFRNNLWEMAYIIVMLFIITWSSYQYYLKRNTLNFKFSIAHFLYLFFALCILGYFDPLFPNTESLGELVYILIFATTSLTLYFHRSLLAERTIPNWTKILLDALIIIPLISLAYLIIGDKPLALKINSFCVLLGTITTLTAAFLSKSNEHPTKRTIIVHYLILFISVFSHLLPILGILQIPALTIDGALFHGIISAIIFGRLLHERSLWELDQLQNTVTQLAVTKREEELERLKLEEQGLFVAMLAHELKNPLASINLTVDTLFFICGQEHHERFARIKRSVNDMDALVKLCVLNDQMETQSVKTLYENFDVIALCKEVIEDFNNQRIVFEEQFIEAYEIESDRDLVRIAFVNLVKNSLVHSPARSKVTITCENSESHLGFKFKNQTRPGIEIDTSAIFDKYSRSKESRSSNGSGLGLYLVQEIARTINSKIDAHHEKDEICLVFAIPKSTIV